jgi:pimeloyl-ACP methyl ester carboxylesterase
MVEQSQVGNPVLVLIGDHDRLNQPKIIELARQMIAHLEAEIIPNAGHLLSMEPPGLVDAHFPRFLSQDHPEN